MVLTTAIPEFYAVFGFRAVPEHALHAAPAEDPAGPRVPGRVMTERPEDVQLLRRLLASRAPVSRRLGSLEDGTVFAVAALLTWETSTLTTTRPSTS